MFIKFNNIVFADKENNMPLMIGPGEMWFSHPYFMETANIITFEAATDGLYLEADTVNDLEDRCMRNLNDISLISFKCKEISKSTFYGIVMMSADDLAEYINNNIKPSEDELLKRYQEAKALRKKKKKYD